MFYIIPELLVGLTVDELPILADAAMAGVAMSPVSIQNICDAVSPLNEGFNECRTVMSCPETETICDDGCDNDFDGEMDGEDSDCPANG